MAENSSTTTSTMSVAEASKASNASNVSTPVVKSNAAPPAKPTYEPVPLLPTIKAAEGIFYDFCNGCRVMFRENTPARHLLIADASTGNAIYDQDVNPGPEGSVITTFKKFFIPYSITITSIDRKETIFHHVFDAEKRKVLVQLPENTLGDTIAWFSPCEAFRKKHNCELYVSMSPFLADLFRKFYPEIHFIPREEVKNVKEPYAAYILGLFFDGNTDYQPYDFRMHGLHTQAYHILGVPPSEEPPQVDLSAPRMIKEKYVCIAAQASAQCKYWNNGTGWLDVIRFLKANGYRVLCVDKDRAYGNYMIMNRMPWGTEDFTGNLPLQQRINLIKDADFFIGLPSGLAWIAWCCKVPVVLISGFSAPHSEFYTPYRVINEQVCHACWNDIRVMFDHKNYLWCPRHQNDQQIYECTRNICGQHVINVIQNIPTFKRS